ncbi:MAG: ATP-binding protein, partial [Atopobiaceae bacterium]|nr:ATP-binding protein [Atopobiaceae bacterium]
MTKLTGRHIEFELFTLSFDEYLGMKGFLGKSIGERRAEFEEYLRYGGFPRALTYDDPEAKATYIEGVVAQVVEKGIKARKKVRNVSTFDRVMTYVTYVINNFGAPTILTNLVDHFNNVEGVPVKRETIAGYLRLLELAKVLNKCERFDLKSRRSLHGEEKCYLADLGIYYARNTDARVSYGPPLENVLYV